VTRPAGTVCASSIFSQRRATKEGIMAAVQTRVSSRTLGMTSVGLGILGLAFCWWAPMGMVLSLAGLMIGLVGWLRSPAVGAGRNWTAVGLLCCAAILALNLIIAIGGYDLVTFTALR
jgi:hypothetical protein